MQKRFLALLVLTTLIFTACVPTQDTPHDEFDSMVDQEMMEDGSSMMDDDTDEMSDSEELDDQEDDSEDSASVELVPYTRVAYEAALAEGKDVFLDVYAVWCSVCKANAPKIEAALSKNTNGNLVAFRVDFDKDTDVRRELGITAQSTYLLIPAGKIADKEVLGPGVVSEASILELVEG